MNAECGRGWARRCACATSKKCRCRCGGANHGSAAKNGKPEFVIDLTFQPVALYADIETFYDMRGGQHSGESDYGVWWRSPLEWIRAPQVERGMAGWMQEIGPWRVSWVEDTGDVYAIHATGRCIALLGTIPDEETIERVLRGWADVCGGDLSLHWVSAQVRHARQGVAA